ncbi:hypothetical protein CCGE531_02195 [Rhizobium sp. CCGE531]|nr:hypothetical protein CCGE531_02195 [Rhizobium sp. CCGE531]AYG71414.1 hypothetical protein CCGE532_02185 [Rhizobium sp. CCGE532]
MSSCHGFHNVTGWRANAKHRASFERQAESTGAIPGKVRSGFPSGIARQQRDRAVQRFREKLNRSRMRPYRRRGKKPCSIENARADRMPRGA